MRVRAGNRSEDEMGHLRLQLLPLGKAGDGREPILAAWMERRLEKDPMDATAMFNLGSLALMAGEFGVAERRFGEALQMSPGDARVGVALGSALAGAGDWEGARQRWLAVVTKDGSYADARFDLGVIDLEHELYGEAEEQFRALLEAEPGDVAAGNGLGSALLATGREGEEAAFAGALAGDSRSFDALFNLGQIAADAGQTEEAIGYLRRAEAERPDDADTHRGLAAMYGARGRTVEAQREAALAQQMAAKS